MAAVQEDMQSSILACSHCIADRASSKEPKEEMNFLIRRNEGGAEKGRDAERQGWGNVDGCAGASDGDGRG